MYTKAGIFHSFFSLTGIYCDNPIACTSEHNVHKKAGPGCAREGPDPNWVDNFSSFILSQAGQGQPSCHPKS